MNRRLRTPRRPLLSYSKQSFDPAMWVFLIYLFIFSLLYKAFSGILSALVFGWYLAMIIDVTARWINKIKFIPKKLALFLSGFLLFALLLFCLIWIIPIAVNEGGKLFSSITDVAGKVAWPDFLKEPIFGINVIEVIHNSAETILQYTASFGVDLINKIVQGLPGAITSTMIFVITAVYFTVLVPTFSRNLYRFVPKSTQEKSFSFIHSYYNDIRHFIGGQMFIALGVGAVTGVGMFIAGVPYAFFLGVLSGITNFIPYLGSLLAGALGLLLGFSYGGVWGLIKALIVVVIANQIEAWVLSPRIQGDRMKLNWFAIILAMFLFGILYGLVGILLAIPMLVFLKKFWIAYIQDGFSRL